MSLSASAFQSFRDESNNVTQKIDCPKPKVTAGTKDWGALYSCIGGFGETVKFFINEEAGTGKVKNVKFMWNNWTKNIGEGIHTDKAIAKVWVSIMATIYAPEKTEEVINTFFSSINKTVESSTHILIYTHHVGPAINEHLFTVTTKQQASHKTEIIKAEITDFQACRTVISKAVNYSETLLSGDGAPIQESGYKSFFINGKNKDMFFCEVRSGNNYKIKAARNGKFPFKYIAQGNLR